MPNQLRMQNKVKITKISKEKQKPNKIKLTLKKIVKNAKRKLLNRKRRKRRKKQRELSQF